MTVPLGSMVVDIISVAACIMVRLRVTDIVAGVDSASETVAVMLNVPTWSVIPEMIAEGVAEAEVSPAGSPEIVQLYGVTPPVAVAVAE